MYGGPVRYVPSPVELRSAERERRRKSLAWAWVLAGIVVVYGVAFLVESWVP